MSVRDRSAARARNGAYRGKSWWEPQGPGNSCPLPTRAPKERLSLWGAFGRNRRGRDLIRDCRTRSDLVGEIDADRFAARKYGADGYVGVRSGLRPTRDQHLIGL